MLVSPLPHLEVLDKGSHSQCFRSVTDPLLGVDAHTLEISEEEERSVVMSVSDKQ